MDNLATLRQRIAELESENRALQQQIEEYSKFEDGTKYLYKSKKTVSKPLCTVRSSPDYRMTEQEFKAAEAIMFKYYNAILNDPERGRIETCEQRCIFLIEYACLTILDILVRGAALSVEFFDLMKSLYGGIILYSLSLRL
jgi:hypothetical protein